MKSNMKKWMLIASTLVVGMLAGAVLMGTVLAAPPTPQGTPTPGANPNPWGRGGMMGGRMGGGWGGMMDVGFEDEVLALLGMTKEQLIAERQAGKSLAQIAEAKGVSEQRLIDTILAAKRADLDALVAQGKLTQAQADAMYQNMQQTAPQMIDSTGTGPMWQRDGVTPPANMPCWGDDEQQPTQPFGPMRGRGGMRGGRWSGPTS